MKKSTSNSADGTATFDVASILSELESPLQNADAARAASLADLASAQTARGYMLQVQRDTLAASLGTAAPQVTALDTSIK
jgi:hypothetical protein